MASACGARRTQTPRRPEPRMRLGPASLQRPSLRWPRTAFWAGLLLEQFGRASADRQLSLELGDLLLRLRQLGVLRSAQARLETPVDPVLTPPAIDRLVTDLEIVRDAGDALAVREQIEDLASKLCRVAPSSHFFLLVSGTR